MSHTTGHSMTQKIGHTIQEWTDHVLSMDRIPLRKKKKVPVLYIEGDGLMLSKGAQEKRPILHRVQIHEGVKEKGTRKHPRPELIHPRFFESAISSHKAFERASQWIEAHYDLRETVVISNSDGGAGYKKGAFENIIGRCKRHEHFRDSFHVNKKIKERLYCDKEMQYPMKQALWAYDKEKIVAVLNTIESRFPLELDEETDKEIIKEYKEEMKKLWEYFMRNWESLKPVDLRDIPVLRGLGVCETNHRPYSYRMKHQGRNFTSKGAGNLAAIVSSLRNGTFVRALTESIPEITQKMSGSFKGAVQQALKKVKRPSMGAQRGCIVNNGPTSSPIGQLQKIFRL